MPRPKKNNLDYFSHDVTMRNDKKVRSLRSLFGNEGYAIYCMMLEVIGEEDLLQLELSGDMDWQLLAGDMDVPAEKLSDILEYLVRLDLLQLDGGFYRCRQLEKRGEMVFVKRGRTLEHLRDVSGATTLESGAETKNLEQKPVKPEQPASDISHSKVNKRKDNNLPYLFLAEKLRDFIVDAGTDMVLKDKHLEKWCQDFRFIVERDGRSTEQVERMLKLIFQDDFWSKNIRSGSKLRKQWNDGKLDRLVRKTVSNAKTEQNGRAAIVKQIDATVGKSYLDETACFQKWNDDCRLQDRKNTIPEFRVNSFCRFIEQSYT